MYNGATELYIGLLSNYFDKYKEFSDDRNNRADFKYNPTNSFLDTYAYKEWIKKKMKNQLTYHSYRYQKVMKNK